jgi:hypothetical protein
MMNGKTLSTLLAVKADNSAVARKLGVYANFCELSFVSIGHCYLYSSYLFDFCLQFFQVLNRH